MIGNKHAGYTKWNMSTGEETTKNNYGMESISAGSTLPNSSDLPDVQLNSEICRDCNNFVFFHFLLKRGKVGNFDQSKLGVKQWPQNMNLSPWITSMWNCSATCSAGARGKQRTCQGFSTHAELHYYRYHECYHYCYHYYICIQSSVCVYVHVYIHKIKYVSTTYL